MKLKASTYTVDKISYKVKILAQALEQARAIISKLEDENKRLLDILDLLQKN